MSRPDGRDLARVLSRKAEGDAKAMRLLAANVEIDDESVGFHAQQAIEKWIKSVMASHDLPQVRKHSLALLLDILAGAGIEAPPEPIGSTTSLSMPCRCVTTSVSTSSHSTARRSWPWSTKSETGPSG